MEYSTEELLNRAFPEEFTLKALDSNSGIPFESKIYQKYSDADLIDRNTFLENLAQIPVSREFDVALPRDISTSSLNFLEYFGLVLPALKFIVPFRCGAGCYYSAEASHVNSDRTPLPQWTKGIIDNKKWTMQVGGKYSENLLSGYILHPYQRDYWNCMRGLWPRHLERIKIKSPELYALYLEHPFDLHYPELRDMIYGGNIGLEKKIVVPMYEASDCHKCYRILSFLYRTLPLDYSVQLWMESHKQRNKGKIYDAKNLSETLWEAFRDSYINGSSHEPKLSSIENNGFDRYFYRNHFITAYVLSFISKGRKVNQACERVANLMLKANPKGEEPLSPVYIYKKIYLPLKTSPLFTST